MTRRPIRIKNEPIPFARIIFCCNDDDDDDGGGGDDDW